MFLVVKINLARSPKIMDCEFINYDLEIYWIFIYFFTFIFFFNFCILDFLNEYNKIRISMKDET